MSDLNKDKLVSFFAFIVTCIFPILFLYAQNIQEVNFQNTIMPIGLFIVIGMITVLIFYVFTKSIELSFFSASIFMLCFSNYSLIERFIKRIITDLQYWHIVPILIVCLFHVVFIMKSKKRLTLVNNLNKLLLISFGGLIVFNIAIAIPVIIEKLGNSINHTDSDLNNINLIENDNLEKKNIYYILLDEYSSFNTIQKYYKYDNSKFANQLENLGFTVSYDSFNDSIDTYTVTGNILNLDYIISDKMLQTEKLKLRENPPLFRLIEKNGYKINNLSDVVKWNGVFAGGLKDFSFSKIDSFSFMIYSNSALYPFISSQNDIENRTKTLTELNALEETYEHSDMPVFTYAHIVCPHSPFVFDKNGNLPPFSAMSNWENKKYYLEQYIYISNRIYDAIKNIVNNDPDSIIILQSDHGVRWIKDDEGKDIKNEDSRSILNCVYYGGENLDEIKGQSGLNTIRIVLNELLKINMPILEVPVNEVK